MTKHRLRKPIGVWVLLSSGNQWMFCCEATIDDAMQTARTLRANVPSLAQGSPLFPHWRVWLAPPPIVGLKASIARFRRRKATAFAPACVAALALLTAGCTFSPRLVVKRAQRCEVQAVAFYWSDGTVGSMALNVCRFGAVGRTPDPSETGDPYIRR